MSSKSGMIWTLALLWVVGSAAVAHADGGHPALPRLLPETQWSRPADMTTLLAQGGMAATGETAETTGRAAGVSHKSPRRAFIMSALIPGSGQFWAGAKVRSALFLGIELAGLGAYLSWDGKGNDLEDDFRARADDEYNPWNYLAWRDSRNSRFSSITHALPCSSFVASSPSSVPVPDAIRGCNGRDTQQFYELVGKYDQFIAGWVDVRDGWDDETDDWVGGAPGNSVTYAEVDSAENYQSLLRLSYEDDRNESNKYLKRASNVLGLILVNHVISAIDAARVARARNDGQDEAIIDRRTRFGVALGGASGRTPMLLALRPFD